MTKRTYQPKIRRRMRVHGFRTRMATSNGRDVLKTPPRKRPPQIDGQHEQPCQADQLEGLIKRKFRLAKRTDFERVRREGTSYAHPFIVLVTRPNESAIVRIGVAAGRSMGSAVERNRAKRRIREAIRPLIPYIPTGWDLLFLARRPQQQADFQHLQAAVQNVLNRAKLLKAT